MWVYVEREVEPSLRLLQTNREYILQLLRLIPDALEREVIVRWPDAGEQTCTVRDVIEMQVVHGAGHVDEINRVREAHGF